jgi:hypothetical protein
VIDRATTEQRFREAGAGGSNPLSPTNISRDYADVLRERMFPFLTTLAQFLQERAKNARQILGKVLVRRINRCPVFDQTRL